MLPKLGELETVGVCVVDAVYVAVAVALNEIVAEGVRLQVAVHVAVTDVPKEGEVDRDGDTETVGDGEADGEGKAITLAGGDHMSVVLPMPS